MRELQLFNQYDHSIPANGKFFLKDIISDDYYRKWFSTKGKGKIFVLNKGRCGNGGTTGFIDYAKRAFEGLSIIVPNISIVKSKEWDDELCCLYGDAGDVGNVDIYKRIRVCTWDKHKTVEGFPQYGMDWDGRFWAGSLLVVDEYHKLIDDSNFREICAKVVKTIINTKDNVVLMSATPNFEFVEFLKDVSGKTVETYNIEYDNDRMYRLQWVEQKDKKLFDIVNEVIRAARQKAAAGKVNQVVFFYNSVKKVSDIVGQLEDNTDVEVLCSKSNEHKGIPCYSSAFNKDKRFHFLTSAYFTGMDIESKDGRQIIDKVIIIGGNDEMVLSYSNKEIKQMLGRIRNGYDATFIIHDGRALNKKTFADFKGKAAQSEFVVNQINGDARKDEHYIQEYLNYLYYTGVVEKMEGWQNRATFEKMMSIYDEYEVKILKIEEPEKFKKNRDISFNEYKRRRLAGEDIPYRYKAVCEKYIELCGLDKFAEAGRNEIERYVKLSELVGDNDIEKLSSEHKYNLLLGNGFFYGRNLMGVLEYLGEKCGYDVLEEEMNKVFGSFCIYDSGDRAKKNGCLFLSILNKDMWKMSNNGDNPLYINDSLLSPISDINRIKTIRVSKKVSKPGRRTQCITDYLCMTNFNPLLDENDKYKYEFFSKLLKDPKLIPGIKQDSQWGKVFEAYKKEQTMISEFYKDVSSKTKYPHKKDEMEKIDSLIVDIDDSISYDEFEKLYRTYEYVAYPSISNPDKENWKKFRVVFPLSQTLSIPNDNLNVLKLLRRMVCKYEDKNHQLGAYVNREQWAMRKENKGSLVSINQNMVVYLQELLKSLKTHSYKFKKSQNGYYTINDTNYYWSLEKGKEYYHEHDKDGERHSALFIIKNRLSDDDCDSFLDWLRIHHPDKVHHWLSHKRMVRIGA